MGSHEILMSRLSAVARNEKVTAPKGDLLLGFKGTPNFMFMGAAGSYGWAVRFGDKALITKHRKRLVELLVKQRSQFMLAEQCAPDPHMAFYLAPVGRAGFAADLAKDHELLSMVNEWLGGFLWLYDHGRGNNSADPKRKMLFMPGFRCVSRTGRTNPVSQDADSLFRLLTGLPLNRTEKDKRATPSSYWGDGSTSNLGLFLLRGLFDRGLLKPKPRPVGVRVPMAFARTGSRLLAWLDVPEPVTGVGACHWLEADLGEGRVIQFGTDWKEPRPDIPGSAVVVKIPGTH